MWSTTTTCRRWPAHRSITERTPLRCRHIWRLPASRWSCSSIAITNVGIKPIRSSAPATIWLPKWLRKLVIYIYHYCIQCDTYSWTGLFRAYAIVRLVVGGCHLLRNGLWSAAIHVAKRESGRDAIHGQSNGISFLILRLATFFLFISCDFVFSYWS